MPSPDPAPADRSAEHPDAIAATGTALRVALRAVPSPVVVVTVGPDGAARGATIGSFASVSLGPPLVSFNVTHGTRLHDALDAGGAFAVHLLAADQADAAAHFASPDADTPARTAEGAARLDGALGTLACTVVACHRAGDHTIVVGEVLRVTPGRDAAPLLYYRQSYRGIGSEV